MSFFDSLDRTKLKEMLQVRVADGSLLRLIGKLLRVGVLDGEAYTTPDRGTAQGSGLSPLLGNVYLHYALDVWFEQVVRPRLGGRAILVRYADDFVIGFERRDDAKRVMDVLPKRLGRYGLTLHADKTRLLPFGRPPRRQQGGKGPASFDFLGFTLYWRRARSGRWGMWCKTRSSRLQRAITVAAGWCRRHRHLPVAVQHAALTRRIQGHFNYFGVSGNTRSLRLLVDATERHWYKWLRRRSHRTRLPRRLGENRLVAPDAAVPDGPEFRSLATQDRCRQVGPRTAVALYGLHERDGPRRLRGLQPRVVEPGTVARRNQRGIGRHRPDDAVAVAAGPKHVGVQGESRLEPQRIEDTHQIAGVVGTGEPAVGEALLRRQIWVFGGRDHPGFCGRPPQAIDPSDGK